MIGIIGAGPAGCFLGSKLAWDKSIIFDKINLDILQII